jgi:prevent-host-death family protein
MVRFKNRQGEQVQAESLTATQAKNEFGRVLERVIRGEIVVITRHDAPKAVLISMDEYQALARNPESQLNSLAGEFDAILAAMQTPKARERMKRAFDASPKQLGKAAVSATRKRG